nr:hypothetical protein [Tanacetum cinerariifolium]
IRISLNKKRRLIAKLEALEKRGDALRSLDYMREIVAHDSCILGILEQLFVCFHVGMRRKEGYVADIVQGYGGDLQRDNDLQSCFQSDNDLQSSRFQPVNDLQISRLWHCK